MPPGLLEIVQLELMRRRGLSDQSRLLRISNLHIGLKSYLMDEMLIHASST